MGPVGFWGALLALLGSFLTPLGLSVGPNVYILSFWRYQTHLEPYEKYLRTLRMSFGLAQVFLRKMWFFTPNSALLHTKMGQNGVHWGVYRVNFGFLRAPDPLEVEIMQFF